MTDFFASQLRLIHAAGTGGIVENLYNSYIWEVKAVRALMALGFQEVQYWACAWGGWRAKNQRLLANMDELQLVAARCEHLHRRGEWRPNKKNGR